jgi:aspartate kinase
MPLIVQKYGGSSVATPEHLRSVARRVTATWRGGTHVIVVVSAMGSTTDELHAMAREIAPDPPRRELDMLVTVGERMAMALLAIAIDAEGGRVVSFTGSQSGIITDSRHGDARIVDVRPVRVREALDQNRIVIVAGYQGVSETKEITTLGRGGTDLTAIALGHAFGADEVELCKDVEGVYSADPRVYPDAVCHRAIPNGALRRLANAGAAIVYAEAVRYAEEKSIEFRVCSSALDHPGTRVTLDPIEPDAFYGAVRSADGDAPTVTAVAGTERSRRLRSRHDGAEFDAVDPHVTRWAPRSPAAADILIAELHLP